jgi:hypothetical protein
LRTSWRVLTGSSMWGAGAAPWSLAIARRNPRCRVTALDLGAVLAVTRRAVATAGQADRFDYVSGDVFDGTRPPRPSGCWSTYACIS